MGCCTSASNRALPPEPKFRTDEPFLSFQEVVDHNEAELFEKISHFNKYAFRETVKQCPPDGQAGKYKGSQDGAQLMVAHGTLEITQEGINKLPPELRIGPWATPKVYEAVVRFNLVEKALRVSLKFDYKWPKSDKYTTSYNEDTGYYGMDILFSATFIEGDNALTFADAHDVYQLEHFAKGSLCTKLYYLLCKTNSIARVLGLAIANRAHYDRVASTASPLDLPYNSKMASACGPGTVKYSLIPPRTPPPPGPPLPAATPPHTASRALLQHQVQDEKHNEFDFDFRIQVATAYACEGPIRAVEDATSLWNELKSAPIVMGKLRLKTGGPEKEALFKLFPEEGSQTMKFSPWSCPYEHRPLGQVGRARRYAYSRHAKYREELLNLPPVKCPFALA